MDLRPLVRPVLRLVDLHDSARRPGTSTHGASEDRPGWGEGLWLDVGARILGYLRAHERPFDQNFIPLARCFEQIRELYPDLSTDDLEQVVIMLATPTRSVMRDPEDPALLSVAKDDTPLLKRPYHERADKARLTRTGRRAIKLVSSAHSFLLTHIKASEIAFALRQGLFDDAVGALDTVVQRLHEVAEDIRQAREQPGREQLVAHFQAYSETYGATLRDTRVAIEDALDVLDNDRIEAELDDHSEAGGGPDARELRRRLQETLSFLENLGRVYTDFLRVVSDASDSPIGVRDLPRMAVYLAFNPPTDDMVAACYAQLGPVGILMPHPAPVDFQGCLPSVEAQRAPRAGTIERPSESEPPVTPMSLFLAEHRSRILELLAHRPVRLSEAREQGWLSVAGRQMVDQLVGVFVNPVHLATDDEVAVSFIRGGLSLTQPDGRRLVGDDLELRGQLGETAPDTAKVADNAMVGSR